MFTTYADVLHRFERTGRREDGKIGGKLWGFEPKQNLPVFLLIPRFAQNFPEMDRNVSFSVVSRRRPTSMRTMLQRTS
jgi:hypothetical protein